MVLLGTDLGACGVQVVILPAHDHLQHAMQLGERRVFPDLDAPPNRRMESTQRHFELIHGTILFSRHDYASSATKMPQTEKSFSHRSAFSATNLKPLRGSSRESIKIRARGRRPGAMWSSYLVEVPVKGDPPCSNDSSNARFIWLAIATALTLKTEAGSSPI